MSRFTTRVELYGNASESVYEKLHDKMYEKQFYRNFTDNGVSYKMPSAMYFSSHQLTTMQVRDLAKSIAATIWNDFAVLVTSTEVRIEHYNLRKG